MALFMFLLTCICFSFCLVLSLASFLVNSWLCHHPILCPVPVITERFIFHVLIWSLTVSGFLVLPSAFSCIWKLPVPLQKSLKWLHFLDLKKCCNSRSQLLYLKWKWTQETIYFLGFLQVTYSFLSSFYTELEQWSVDLLWAWLGFCPLAVVDQMKPITVYVANWGWRGTVWGPSFWQGNRWNVMHLMISWKSPEKRLSRIINQN